MPHASMGGKEGSVGNVFALGGMREKAVCCSPCHPVSGKLGIIPHLVSRRVCIAVRMSEDTSQGVIHSGPKTLLEMVINSPHLDPESPKRWEEKV